MSASSRALSRGGRSFAFASRLLPAADRERVARIYAYCRATDDLVDDHWDASTPELEARLDDWLQSSRAAHRGSATGVDVIDVAMTELRRSDVSFACVEQLISGMRMDAAPRRYADLAELSTYTVRVAGVVGVMMCGLFDARGVWLEQHALMLGCAMQLTNIVRDVGEDLDRGRLYLPQSLLRSYGVREGELREMRDGRPITPAYRAAIESLLTYADATYSRAFAAIPYLPPAFGRTTAVAAAVYRGIHHVVRQSGYDNLTRRATTTLSQKCALGIDGLRRAWSTRQIDSAAAPVVGPVAVDASLPFALPT
jgi:phytoene synthase